MPKELWEVVSRDENGEEKSDVFQNINNVSKFEKELRKLDIPYKTTYFTKEFVNWKIERAKP